MKILHTSDWHLGISVHGYSMLEEQKHFKDELISIIRTVNADAVLVSGDVFDSSVATGEAIGLYNDIATEICLKLGVPLIVTAGNHDGAARLSSMHELLKKSGLYVIGRLTRNTEPVIIGNAAIYPLPHFNTDEVRALYPDEKIKTYESAVNTVCSKLRGGLDKSRFNIIMAHVFASGAALSDSDRSAVIGTASMVSHEVFKGFDCAALGHLHKPQKVCEHVYYSGSPVKYSFSEAKTDKSVNLIDTDTGEVTQLPLEPIHDMRIIKGTLEEILSESCNDYVKAEITDGYAGLEALEALSAGFPHLLAVTGKAAAESDAVSVDVNDMEKLSPSEMLDSFFNDNYGETADNDFKELFAQALSDAENGGELQ